MADDQTVQDQTPDDSSSSDSGVNFNSDQIMELMRRFHTSTPQKPPTPPKSPYQANPQPQGQQPPQPQQMQQSPQRPQMPQMPQQQPQQPQMSGDYNPSGQRPAPQQLQQGQVRDQPTGAAISPGTADRVAWSRQQGDKLQQQDQQSQQNISPWQKLFMQVKQANRNLPDSAIVGIMQQLKKAGALPEDATTLDNQLKQAKIDSLKVGGGKTPTQEGEIRAIMKETNKNYEDAAAEYMTRKRPGVDEIGKVAEAKNNAKLEANKPKAQEKIEDMSSSMDNTIKFIGMARKQVSGMTTGMGSILSGIPGSPAKDLESTVQTIKSNIGFDKLQTMKDESPTGSALGRVTNMEIQLLQNVVANLDTGQSQDQFKLHLDIAEEEVKKAKDRIANAYDLTYGAGGAEAAEKMLGKSDSGSASSGGLTSQEQSRLEELRAKYGK